MKMEEWNNAESVLITFLTTLKSMPLSREETEEAYVQTNINHIFGN